MALKNIITVKNKTDLSSLKKNCWSKYANAFLKTGHFNLKNLIADFILFTNQNKNSIYDLNTISTYFKSNDKVDTLLIKLINHQNNTQSYQKFIVEALSMPSNPDNHFALQTFATGSDA